MLDLEAYYNDLDADVYTCDIFIFSSSWICSISKFPKAGSIGMISWVIYVLLMRINIDMMTSNFIAASIAALLSEILARKMKKPTILFIVPGIITLIPGLGLYNTMSYVVEEDFQLAFTTGANVLLASGAIALGVIVISSLFRTYYRNLREKLHINRTS